MRLIVTGGGTGGHIYPAVAIAHKCQDFFDDAAVLYIGKKGGLEEELVPLEDIAFQGIVVGYRRSGIAEAFIYLKNLAKGFFQAWRLIRKFKPDVILGTGGYVSVPTVFVGALLGIPTVIHESNALPGRANRFLAKRAQKILVNFEKTTDSFLQKEKVVVSGFPVRNGFHGHDKKLCKKNLKVPENAFFIVAVGGSGGAEKINRVVVELSQLLIGYDDIHMIHATGKKYFDNLEKERENIGKIQNVKMVPYVYDMPTYMGAADLVITRAGASALAEVQASDAFAIMVPSPNVKDNHQLYNARAAEEKALGIVVEEKDLSANLLLKIIKDQKFKNETGKATKRKPFQNNALDRIMDILKGFSQKQEGHL